MENKKYALVGLHIEGEENPTRILMEQESLNAIFAGVLPTKAEGTISFTSIDSNIAIMGQVVELLDPENELYRVIDANKATFLNRVTSFVVKPYLVTVDTHGYLMKVED
ncbi:hypothetical protein FP435_04630 [Lactobacillus sp. PV037]|uniref:hypothetical protein n=1 Tax=Lactobacillus sp. PV037 TaxID=2594496 RepID=UPI00223F86D4|nr:hypothetical protein [Lactobacillus sp. PV037]QNQ83777.1 hypothetical protein FP435_04630 [Lactobacillus sp. PV037]